jgi:polyhydroxyalkanoate synthesis regulator phasin
MPNAREELAEKKRKLQELIRARSKATCSTVVSTEIDVRRETEIEDLEEQIEELEKQVKSK